MKTLTTPIQRTPAAAESTQPERRGKSQEGTPFTEVVHSLVAVDRSPHFLPEGGNENSPGWTLSGAKGQSGEGVPILFARPVGPR
jgi:hypothetical protein